MTDGEQTPDALVGRQLSTQLSTLNEPIREANRPGNLEGLLAHHVLGGRRLSFTWDIDPMTEDWLRDNEHRLAQPAGLAALGYGLTAFPSHLAPAARDHVLAGLPAVMRRDPFPRDGVSFVNDLGQLTGLTLAVSAVAADAPKAYAWLRDILQDSRLRAATPLLQLFQDHARHLIGLTNDHRPDPNALDDPVDLAALHWLISAVPGPNLLNPGELRALRARLLDAILLNPPERPTAVRAALLIEAATRIVTTSIDEQLLDASHVGILLNRFPDAMRRWRHDTGGQKPIQWPITSEREVQDILWCMLRPVFDDLVDEETLRKIGHSSYRADFAIPSLGLLIEVKYASKASQFKEFEQEISVDYLAYLSDNEPYRKMAVFIYDETCSVQHHGTTRNRLLALPDITDVVIVCRPSHVPAPQRPPGNRRPTATARS